MRNYIALAALLWSTTACSAMPAAGAKKAAVSEPAPAQVTGQWQFRVAGKDGVREPVVTLTKEPAKTCQSGDWLKAVVVSPGSLAFSQPAYTYSNGRLELLLSSELCDAYTSLVGNVSGGRFSGTHVSDGLFGSIEHGKVTGVRQP
ncbi:hypothetical protein [Stenotrophomonas acidaminiphila]|uniref:hypothetical protein n=1 Tax=Stenotrophomonas acidaminiphila TaxID=128780 RepID=UPI00289D4DE9|nr:hypothetical protein [Stenotrophomonas acidaminiphila]